MIEMENILWFWLKTADPNTVLFSRLILVYAIIMALNNPISIIIQATGHIKEYHIPVEIFTLLCVPATYILYKLGYPAYTTYTVMIIAAIASHIVRLICLKKFYKPFNFPEYLKSFLLPAFVITLFSSSIVFLIHKSIADTLIRVTAVGFISFLIVTLFVMLIGLSKSEKDIIKQLIASVKRK
jgi:hypothetical protein